MDRVHGASHAPGKDALEYLGASEYIPLLDGAVVLYPTFAADTPDERLSASEEWSGDEQAQLEALDDAFHRLEEQRGLVEQYAAAYVAAHPEAFPAS